MLGFTEFTKISWSGILTAEWYFLSFDHVVVKEKQARNILHREKDKCRSYRNLFVVISIFNKDRKHLSALYSIIYHT